MTTLQAQWDLIWEYNICKAPIISQVQAFLATYATLEVIHESVEIPRSRELC